MLKKITEKISRFVIFHPTGAMYGISLGVTAVIAAGIGAFANPSHMAHAMFMQTVDRNLFCNTGVVTPVCK
jgi:hypothetical protein